MQQAVTHLRPHLQSAKIFYFMQKRLFFKIGCVCKIPWGVGYVLWPADYQLSFFHLYAVPHRSDPRAIPTGPI